ncbi:MAG: 2-oxoglutarate dehydrogenase complex dihydrolipoyllysine-residue succinyltransferase [Gemmataceae bacterium]|nr:2-oxoglutarate dehydrogenase complex dihydrolipoyllysine-residue succinyltransferase [Gemmataceae bacterium]
MPTDVKVPTIGESITEGTLARWIKKDGDSVRADEPLFELETEKATTEIPSPASGTLRTAVAEGDTVKIGAVVGRIEASADGPAKDGSTTAKGQAAAQVPKRAEAAATAPSSKDAVAPPSAVAEPAPLSPAARRLAAESGVDLAAVKGSGRDGRIIKEDVQRLVEVKESPAQPVPEAKPATVPRESRQRMSAIRQRIAERLVASQRTTATLTTFNEADMAAVNGLRDRYKERFQEKHGTRLGLTGFFVKAVVEALRAFPIVHSRMDGADIVTPQSYDIGMAVNTERGLMVPVVRDADRLGFAQIEKTIAALAQKARDGKIALTDLQGGNFTITNGGVFGSLLSTPILNPPQSAILGLHTIQKRPVVVNDQIVIRPMMYIALSYDHRLIDGREAVQFLVRVKECIENPERLLLEV